MAKKSKKKLRRKSKYQVGGTMYNNTIPPTLSTTNIVSQESDPNIQLARQEKLDSATSDLIQSSSEMGDNIVAQEEQDNQELANIIAQDEAKIQTIDSALGSGIKSVDDAKKAANFLKSIKEVRGLNIAKDLSTQASAATAVGQEGIKAGVQTSTQAAATETGKQLSQEAIKQTAKSTGIPVGVVSPTASTASTAGSAAGTASSAASNANLYALGAKVGGEGIKYFADDDDPTTWTFGEASGDVLAETGEFAGYGTMIAPGIGTAIGAGVGFVKGIAEGFIKRGKARREKSRFEAKRKRKIEQFNKDTQDMLASEMSNVRAGAIRQKTKSGYDLGINTTARMGGLKMAMPRYGFKI